MVVWLEILLAHGVHFSADVGSICATESFALCVICSIYPYMYHTLLHKCYEALCIQLKSMALILYCLCRHNRTFCHISGLVHNNDIKKMDGTSPLLPTMQKGLYTGTANLHCIHHLQPQSAQLLPGSTGRAQLSLIMFHIVVVWLNSYMK